MFVGELEPPSSRPRRERIPSGAYRERFAVGFNCAWSLRGDRRLDTDTVSWRSRLVGKLHIVALGPEPQRQSEGHLILTLRNFTFAYHTGAYPLTDDQQRRLPGTLAPLQHFAFAGVKNVLPPPVSTSNVRAHLP